MQRQDQYRLAKTAYRNLWIMAVLTMALLVLLAVAPAKSYFREWRGVQEQYNQVADARGVPTMVVGIKQIWRPEIKLTDRCISCHVGMGATEPLAGTGVLFDRHPDVHHDVGKMGCTICHRGQGLATDMQAAHGDVKHWDDPMLPRAFLEASCGQCHGASAVVPALDLVERGRYLFELHGCRSCQVVDGEGGRVGPDLSGVALKGFTRDWHILHLRQPAVAVEGSRMMSFGHLTDGEIDALLAYLDTLIGAPTLVRGKAIAVQNGCRGCHQIGGVGGDHGVALHKSAATFAVDRDFTHVEGVKTTENWHRQHLREPQRVSPGSKMPGFTLSQADEDALITFILSERRPDVPMSELPRQAVITRLGGGRDHDAGDGDVLYRMYCSACHGDGGSGRVMPTLRATVPAIGNADFLAVASDQFLRAAIAHGRPGREMPGWASPTGLSDTEIDTLVAWLRERQPAAPTLDDVRAETADPGLGARVFAGDCTGCHGSDGEGTVIAPSLINPEFRALASVEYLYRTVVDGRANTAMPAHRRYSARQLAGLIAWIRGPQQQPEKITWNGQVLEGSAEVDRALSERLLVDTLANYRATGTASYGKVLYDGLCLSCHGTDGLGGIGPAIANPDFLAAASDGFIAGSMMLGRGQRAMRSFDGAGISQLRSRDIGDLITYLREVSRRMPEPVGRKRAQGSTESGRSLYQGLCSGCHGPDGESGFAPALANSAFLAAATDGYLQATIARGRRGTSMRGWAKKSFGFAELTPEEINDIVAYIRSWQTGDNQ